MWYRVSNTSVPTGTIGVIFTQTMRHSSRSLIHPIPLVSSLVEVWSSKNWTFTSIIKQDTNIRTSMLLSRDPLPFPMALTPTADNPTVLLAAVQVEEQPAKGSGST